MSRLSLAAKLAAAFGITMLLLLAVTAVAVTRMGTLADRTADAKRGAILDEQIMSMEIAAREALDIEASAILSGAPTALDSRLDAAWNRNDGDAFAEALAEAKRLAVLDMPTSLRASAAAAETLEQSVARSVELVRAGNVDGARANRRSASLAAFNAFTDLNQAVEGSSEAFSEAASVGATEAASGGKRDRGHRGGLRAPARRRQRGDDHPRRHSRGARDPEAPRLTARPRHRRPVRRPRRGLHRGPDARDRPVDRPDRVRRHGRDRPRRPRRGRDPRHDRPLDRRLQRDARAARDAGRRPLRQRRHRLLRVSARRLVLG